MIYTIAQRRRYGKSSGAPSEEGLRTDAQTALDFIRTQPANEVDPHKLVVFGQSYVVAMA